MLPLVSTRASPPAWLSKLGGGAKFCRGPVLWRVWRNPWAKLKTSQGTIVSPARALSASHQDPSAPRRQGLTKALRGIWPRTAVFRRDPARDAIPRKTGEDGRRGSGERRRQKMASALARATAHRRARGRFP